MGHRPSDVWGYTPREIAGFLDFSRRRRKIEHVELLSLHALAARGESSDLESRMHELTRGV